MTASRSRGRNGARATTAPTADLPGLAPALGWRSLGPFRGGRVVAVAGDPLHPQTFYFGSTGGGVWKTTSGGRYWENGSDGAFARASVGALAVAPSDPSVVYVGMGEATLRGNVAHGDGVYRSRDAGRSWQHLGLEATRHIGRVRIHPHDAQRVYVAALGHAHGPNAARGVYRTTDGGARWEQVLTHPQWPEAVGAHDLSLDPTTPSRLYAALWRVRRLPHALASGGDGCGLWRSLDGGDSWCEITHHPGLPKVPVGKMGIVASPARAGRVWAIIEAAGDDRGIYRSDDGGDTWEHLCSDRALTQRPWYYQHIHADPQDPETVWVLNVRLWRSTDGGRSFARLAVPHGDNHDLWIDPQNPQRLIEGNDGGACVSFDGGETWSSLYNQPTAELYHVTTDTQTPYRIYGAQQDNTTISLPSRSQNGAITLSDAREVGGGESGYIAVRPDDPNIVYAGSYQGYITRYDLRTGQRRDITIWPEHMMGWPAKDARYRFQWTFPIHLSPHDPHTLYVAGNHVFRSHDEGASWQVISPDLTRHDPERLGSSGGPVTKDNVGTEYYGTVFALAESPCQPGVLWAGSDDGLVHHSSDGGATWTEVTPPDLPPWALISLLEPSPHDPATAYLAATRYKLDDFAPYLYATDDAGRHWRRLTSGLPDDVFTRAIREDPVCRGLLYAGTETGVWVSPDGGARWQALQLNLPVVPIHDLVVHGSDLVVATHGRGCWVLDDLTPLRALAATTPSAAEDTAPARLFSPRPAIKFASDGGFGLSPIPGINFKHTGVEIVAYRQSTKPDGESEQKFLEAGENPHDGAYINYLLNDKPEGDITLSFHDAEGQEIRRFSSAETKTRRSFAGDLKRITGEQSREKDEPRVPKEAGLNRFYWDMRYPEAAPVEGYVTPSGVLAGPAAPPGRYQVRLTVGEQTQTAWFEVLVDPRVTVSPEDSRAQFELLLQIRDKISDVHRAISAIQSTRQQLADWERRANERRSRHRDDLARLSTALKERLRAIEEALIQTENDEDDDTLRFPIKLNIQLAVLYDVVGSAEAAPTQQSREVYAHLAARADEQLARMRGVFEGDLAALNALIRDAEIPAIVPSATQ